MTNKISRLKQAGLVTLAGLAMLPAMARGEEQETRKPITFTQRAAMQDEVGAKTHTLLSYGSNRLMVRNTEDSWNYGLNLENSKLKVNFGFEDNLGDDRWRALLKGKFSGGFAGLEYQNLPGTNKEDRFGVLGGLKLTDCLDVQFKGDNDQNLRGVLFVQPWEETLVSFGGGKGRDGDREFNVAYSTKLSERYGVGAHARRGDNDSHDYRVRIGPNVSWQKTRAFGVEDGCCNDVGVIGDLTDPAAINGFNLFGADACVGDETGDVGLDIRHQDGFAYANVAVNAGDYGFFRDVTVSPEVHENRVTGVDGYRVGLSAVLGDTGLKIWVQRSKDEGRDADTALYAGFDIDF